MKVDLQSWSQGRRRHRAQRRRVRRRAPRRHPPPRGDLAAVKRRGAGACGPRALRSRPYRQEVRPPEGRRYRPSRRPPRPDLRRRRQGARPPGPRYSTRRLNKKVRALGLRMRCPPRRRAAIWSCSTTSTWQGGQDQGAPGEARQARLRQDRPGDRRRCAQRRFRPGFVEPAEHQPAAGRRRQRLRHHAPRDLVLTRAAVEKLEARFNG